jgi:hypothetical protein
MRMAKGARQGVFVRMDDRLLEQIDAYVERLKQEQPGMTATRSDAIRVLIHKGLDVVGKAQAGGEA